VKITVWDQDVEDEEKFLTPLHPKFWKDEADDFLGQIVLKGESLVEDLLKAPGYRIDRWFTLQKRSKRSRIAGEIRLVMDLDEDQVRALQGITREEQENIALNRSKESLVSVPPTLEMETQPLQFPNHYHLFKHLLNKLLAHESLASMGDRNEGSLSKASEAILNEVGERLRLGKVWRELCYFKILCDQYRNPPSIDQVH
jgi:hypothetical protein